MERGVRNNVYICTRQYLRVGQRDLERAQHRREGVLQLQLRLRLQRRRQRSKSSIMSDHETPPAKPKPGSLRDRIAAFEQKPSASAPPPLAPRPKPGHVQWKPRVATPPSSPPPTGKGEGSGSGAIKGKFGMSAADAKESIGAGGSLKDRMAALQGKGAFGAPVPPPPRPASEKPKWKPHPIVATLSDDTQEDIIHPKDTHGSTDEATAEVLEEEHQHTDSEKPNAEEGDSETKEVDPEEEERQRRAAIAARIARLGGARVGMAPPVFGIRPPPPIKPKRSTGDDTNPAASPTTTEKAHTEGKGICNNTTLELTNAICQRSKQHQTKSSRPLRQNQLEV